MRRKTKDIQKPKRKYTRRKPIGGAVPDPVAVTPASEPSPLDALLAQGMSVLSDRTALFRESLVRLALSEVLRHEASQKLSHDVIADRVVAIADAISNKMHPTLTATNAAPEGDVVGAAQALQDMLAAAATVNPVASVTQAPMGSMRVAVREGTEELPHHGGTQIADNTRPIGAV